MSKIKLSKDKPFVVRESAGLNFIIAGFCWVVLITLVANYSSEYTARDNLMSGIVGFIVLAAAIVFTLKGIKRKECIRMNSDGIFYYRRLITNWENLESAQVTEENKMFTIKDNFVLILSYAKEEGTYMRKIALTNTQDKSEEEILEAIKFYSGVTKSPSRG